MGSGWLVREEGRPQGPRKRLLRPLQRTYCGDAAEVPPANLAHHSCHSGRLSPLRIPGPGLSTAGVTTMRPLPPDTGALEGQCFGQGLPMGLAKSF